MSIQNAVTFISNIDTNKDLRTSCYSCRSQVELLGMVRAQGLVFSGNDFSDAVNILLFKCQTYEQAERVKEIAAWFSLFH